MNEKILELEAGQEFSNYKELCKFLNEDVKAGSSKTAQFKKWSKYFTIEKIGHRIVILENLAVKKTKLDWNIGDTFKNYKEICIALKEEEKAGNSKVSQLKHWEQYFSWEYKGYSFVITDIHNRDFVSKNAFSTSGNTPNDRLEDMQSILLHLLAVPENLQEFGKMIISKSQLNKVMGIVNPRYYSLYQSLITEANENVSTTEGAKLYYQKTKKMFERDILSVFNSLVKKKLINYTQVVMGTPTEKGDETVANYSNGMVRSLIDGKRVELPLRELTDDEVTLLQKIEYAALVKMGVRSIGQIHAQNKYERFKRAVDEEFAKQTGLIKVYRAYKILYSKEVLEHYALNNKRAYQLDSSVIEKLRLMINQSYQDSICQNAENLYDRHRKKYSWGDLNNDYKNATVFIDYKSKKVKADYMFSKLAYYFSADSVKDTKSLTNLLIKLDC